MLTALIMFALGMGLSIWFKVWVLLPVTIGIIVPVLFGVSPLAIIGLILAVELGFFLGAICWSFLVRTRL
jgi:hypothetical protein